MKRNLLYYVWPCKSNNEWRLNVETLCSYWDIFNNRKIVFVAQGAGLVDIADVRSCFPKDAVLVEFDDSSVLCELKPFYAMLEIVQSLDPEEVSFYAHTKGASPKYENMPHIVGNIRIWRNLSYYFCLRHVDNIDSLLNRFFALGCFKKNKTDWLAEWHFAGTFFWFKHDKVFAFPNWRKVFLNNRFAVEAFLGNLLSKNEAYCLFADDIHSSDVIRRYFYGKWLKILVQQSESTSNSQHATEYAQHIVDENYVCVNKEQIIDRCLVETRGVYYLEIGVFHGQSLFSVCAKYKFGIDPKIFLSPNPLKDYIKKILARYRGIRLFEMTSDHFFETRSGLLIKHGIDVAFIDGLHTYEQSLRDVLHCLDFLDEQGFIVMHDCNPMNRDAAVVAPSKEFVAIGHPDGNNVKWCGDVWKTIVNLRSTRTDLDICVLDCDCGVGLIKKAKPKNTLNISRERIQNMEYDDLAANRAELLNLKKPEYLHRFLSS